MKSAYTRPVSIIKSITINKMLINLLLIDKILFGKKFLNIFNYFFLKPH